MPANQTPAQNTKTNLRDLSSGETGGTRMGLSSLDAISFYGAAPAAQRTGPAQAAPVRGQAAGMVATFTPDVVSPAAVAGITSGERLNGANLLLGLGIGGTAWGGIVPTAGDVVIVNKPTSQAGLGVGNARYVSAGKVGVTLTNFTVGSVTPTASQAYQTVLLRGLGAITSVLSPASVAASTTVEQQFAITGVQAGQLVQVSKPTVQAGLDIIGCRAVSNNVLGITFCNVSASPILPTAAETYTVQVMPGYDAANSVVTYGINIASALAGGVATISAAETVIPCIGITVDNLVIGYTKPTAQAGVALANARAYSTNNLAFTYVNPTVGTVTPTASEIYGVTVLASAGAPIPMIRIDTLVSPASVAANTTAEQTFTVTGLPATSTVWVNKPSFTAGLGIAGVRVSAKDTLAINYANNTATAIVPPAEIYLIGSFQQLAPSAGSVVAQTISMGANAGSALMTEARTTLVGLGLMAGA